MSKPIDPSSAPTVPAESAERRSVEPTSRQPTAGMLLTPTLRLERPLGQGGMGAVWLAHHAGLRSDVVVKFIVGELSESEDALSRFRREAAAASRVRSPHVVQILDHGVAENGLPFIVMELLEGRDLSSYLDEKRTLPPLEVLAIVVQLARALSKAHERGIVHRDIKPSNVFLCDAGSGDVFVKLLDFGIAKTDDLALGETTRSGTFVGSPYYMSPEQIVGSKQIDFRTDLWSLGILVFELLTGKKPYQAETVGGLAVQMHRDPTPKLTAIDPTLPVAADNWFARACARESVDRFSGAREMAEALSVALTGATPSSALADSFRVSVSSRPRLSGPPGSEGPMSSSGMGRSTASGVGVSIPPHARFSRSVKVVVGVAAGLTSAVLLLGAYTLWLRPSVQFGATGTADPQQQIASPTVPAVSLRVAHPEDPAPSSASVVHPEAGIRIALGPTASAKRKELDASVPIPSALVPHLPSAVPSTRVVPAASQIIYHGPGIH